MNKKLKLGLAISVPLLIGGWWLFRPERLFFNLSVSEEVPANARVVSSGKFTSDAHETKGRAQVLESNGRWYLRLSEFSTSNGPLLKVKLVQGQDASTTQLVKQSRVVDLGALKGNIGDQNYEIPAGTDLEKYNAVSVWCERFSVNFGGASLKKL